MKIEQGVSLRINAPEFFKDQEFINWLNNDHRKFTWHKGGQADDWSDVVVGVDPSLNGEGTDSDMPEHIWEQIVKACRGNYKSAVVPRGIHILVWISNLDDLEMATNIAPGRRVGKLMPLEDSTYPWVIMRRTCQSSDQYLGRLPASDAELRAYKSACGLDPQDIYVLNR